MRDSGTTQPDEAAAETWLSPADFEVLHSQIRPNLMPVVDFRNLALGGKLAVYSRSDIDKVFKKLRQMLKERGRLIDASSKADARLTKVQLAAHMRDLMLADDGPRADVRAQAERINAINAGQPVPPSPSPPSKVLVQLRHRAESNGAARSLSQPQPATPARLMYRRTPLATPLRHPPVPYVPAPPQPRSPTEPYESPLLRIEHALKRLRVGNSFGSTANIDLPPECVPQLASRVLRLVLVPVQGSSFIPAPWPAELKDFMVKVNNSIVNVHKRKWPARQHEMHKAYLALDISMYVNNKNRLTHRVEIDCMDRNYSSMVLVATARPYTEAEAAREVIARSESTYYAAARMASLIKVYRAGALRASEDDDLAETATMIAVKDPVSQRRMATPARGVQCEHLQCFDLEPTLKTCHTSGFWNCPLCDRMLPFRDFIIDPLVAEAIATAPHDTRMLRLEPFDRRGELPPYRWLPERAPPPAPRRGGAAVADPVESTDDDDGDLIKHGNQTLRVVHHRPQRNRGTVDCPIAIE